MPISYKEASDRCVHARNWIGFTASERAFQCTVVYELQLPVSSSLCIVSHFLNWVRFDWIWSVVLCARNIVLFPYLETCVWGSGERRRKKWRRRVWG